MAVAARSCSSRGVLSAPSADTPALAAKATATKIANGNPLRRFVTRLLAIQLPPQLAQSLALLTPSSVQLRSVYTGPFLRKRQATIQARRR